MQISSWPCFGDEELSVVSNVLRSGKVNYWTGTECIRFEEEFSNWCNVRYSIALANGTVALDVALRALGVGAGDEVIVTSRTFIGSVSCIVNLGAVPIFVDVDSNSGNISVNTISSALTLKTKAIICVHLAGWPCDMDPIMDFARANSIKVLEDCAQAHGAIYRGRKVGSIGDVAAWSFCQDKIISTGGEGGMVTTNNMELWRFMWAYKDHGKNIDLALGRQRTTEFRWLHDSFGTNYRLTEMQAAIGRVQLRRLAEWTMLRNRNARVILDACRDTTLVRTPSLSGCSCNGSGKNRTCESLCCVHAYYRCYVYIRKERLKVGWSRDRILRVLNEQGVLCNQGSCSEVYLEKAFIETALSPPHQLKNAKELGESSIAFMVHPTLTMHSMAEMSLIIVNVLSEASN